MERVLERKIQPCDEFDFELALSAPSVAALQQIPPGWGRLGVLL